MSQAVLSDDRVAELVAAVQEGREAPPSDGSAQKARRVRTVDFTRPSKFGAEHQRRISQAHESFCLSLATRLGSDLRLPLDADLIDISQLTFQKAHAEIPHTAVFAVIGANTGTPMLAALELPFTLFAIERMLGGPAAFTARERRLTDIDRALVRRLFALVVEPLSAEWVETAGIALTLGDIESHEDVAGRFVGSEAVAALTTELRLEATSATLTLLIPWGTVEPVADRLGDSGAGDDTANPLEPMVRAALGNVGIPLVAEVGGREATVEEILRIAPGDVIRLGTPAAAGITLRAGNVAVATAVPGRSGRRRAVQVTRLAEGLA